MVMFHDFSKSGGARNKVVGSPLPVALMLWLDHTLLHLKPQAEECFQLGDNDGLKVLGVVWCRLRLLDLLASQVCLVAHISLQ